MVLQDVCEGRTRYRKNTCETPNIFPKVYENFVSLETFTIKIIKI